MPRTGVKFTVTPERIHWNPDVTIFHDLLSKEECEHLIQLAEPHLKRSGTFTSSKDSRRTSSSYFLMKERNDPVVKEVIYRCSLLTGYPISHVEVPQIVRYRPGEKFISHADNFPLNTANYKQSGQRDYTFFVYLNGPDLEDPEQTGGETKFSYYDISVKPKQGAGTFWRNVKIPTGEDEEYKKIAHSGLPTQNWTKYGMNVWIRHKPWGNFSF